MLRAWLLTLRGRLLVVLGVGLAFLLAALAVNVVQLRTIGRSLELVNQVYLPLATLSTRMVGQLDPARGGPDALARSIGEARALLAAPPPAPDAEEAAALAATRVALAGVEGAQTQRTAAPAGDTEARAALRDAILQLNALVETRLGALSVKTGRTQVSALRQAGALVLLSGVMSAAVLYLVGSALGPVSRLTVQARQLAAGERVAPQPTSGRDEIATLTHAFAQMAAAVDDRDRHLQALTLYLRRVLDSIGAAVVVTENDVIRMVNPPAMALWSVAEGGPLPTDLAALPEGRHEARAVGDRHQDVVVRPFGERGRIIVGEDSTERVRDRERLQRSERLALVGQMLAQVTHEVRNPLNAMSLHAELLGDEVSTEEGAALLGVITAEIRRLEQVTERYLDLARRRPPERSPEDPVALARSVAALEEESMRRQGVDIAVHGAPGQVVEIDGNVLRRALLNLTRNAAEAGAHHVRIEVEVVGAILECRVNDDGQGMPPEVTERVFEPFYSRRARGTGLGLAITRQAIEDLDGTITCTSEAGVGTTFTVRLPVTSP